MQGGRKPFYITPSTQKMRHDLGEKKQKKLVVTDG